VEQIERREMTVGKTIAGAVDAIRAKLAARERAREPIVVIEAEGESRVSKTVAKMESKGYILDHTESTTHRSILLRFRANE
jgi:hypothetical protein